ncbi:hypothetical protein ACQ4PT_003807 [Festuca glaucescens]
MQPGAAGDGPATAAAAAPRPHPPPTCAPPPVRATPPQRPRAALKKKKSGIVGSSIHTMWEKAAKTRKTDESSTPNQTATASSVVHLESNLQMVLWQAPESREETSTPHVEVEDDESIDEDDEMMQADLEALEHDPGKRIPISMYDVNDQDRLAHLLNALSMSCKKMRLLRIAQAEELIASLELEEVETGSGLNQEMGLGRPCDTRWGSHFKTVNHVISMYGALRRVLRKIGDEYNSAEAQAALTIETTFLSFEFVFMAHLMQEIFGYTDDLSRALQKQDEDIVHAIQVLDDTKFYLGALRSDAGWDDFLTKVTSFCTKHKIKVVDMEGPYFPVGRPRRGVCNGVINYHRFKVDMFVSVIDRQIGDLGGEEERLVVVLVEVVCAVRVLHVLSLKMSETKSEASATDGAASAAAGGGGEKEGRKVDGSRTTPCHTRSRGDDGIDSMFGNLEIGEDEFDDFVLEEDEKELEERTRWLAVARVNCRKKFSHEALFQQMHAAWNSSQKINIRAVDENRFVIQCFCLADWEKVMERGPWLFRDWVLVTAPYDGYSDPSLVVLDYMPIWIQVHKLPEAYRKERVIKPLIERSAGEVIMLEMNPSGAFKGDYVRLRIKHDVRRPLTRFVSIVLDKKRSLYAVKYEKLGQLCFACGLIGHEYKECGDGIYEEKSLKFGDWIYASGRGRGYAFSCGNTRGNFGGSRGNGDGSFGGRGGFAEGRGRGRGGFVDWREHPERVGAMAAIDPDLLDTANSPGKNKDETMPDADKAAKRRLEFGDDTGNANLAIISSDMVVDGVTVNPLFEKEDSSDSKRQKKEDGTTASNQNAGSAASLEDDRRAQ